jgi:acyl-homoserine lactone acylase PvdQ
MKGDSIGALLFNVMESELIHSIYFHLKEIKQIPNGVLNNLIETPENVNYLIYKLKQYVTNPEVCLKEYGLSCSEFIIQTFIKTTTFIEERLGRNIQNWKWNNLNVKHFMHKPFSMIPGLNLLAHRTIQTDGNKRTVKVSMGHNFNKSFAADVSSNLKFVMSLPNDIFFSIDGGQNGRIFHRHYDDRLLAHERGDLIHYDKNAKGQFTIQFQKSP